MHDASAQSGSIPQALLTTNFDWLGTRYQGKVRDSYIRGDTRVLVATDRLSAFDRPISSVPGKGQILTRMAEYWFQRTRSVVANHVIAVPDPCVVVAREVSIIPIEVVVRGFLAGSAWRDYKAGRAVSGVMLAPGLQEFDQLPTPIITPSTKEAVGSHDQPIAESEIVARGVVAATVWEQVRELALTLFSLGTRELEERGLLFVDTKYEFGLVGDTVVLADEIHTLDCSRFWVKDTYDAKRAQGEAPEMLDKEPVRRWLMARGFSGEGPVPLVSDEYRLELRRYYKESAERIIGTPIALDDSEPLSRVERNIRQYFKE